MSETKKTHDEATDQAFAARIAMAFARPEMTRTQVLDAAPSAGEVPWTDPLLFAPADSIAESDALEELPGDDRAITDAAELAKRKPRP